MYVSYFRIIQIDNENKYDTFAILIYKSKL